MRTILSILRRAARAWLYKAVLQRYFAPKCSVIRSLFRAAFGPFRPCEAIYRRAERGEEKSRIDINTHMQEGLRGSFVEQYSVSDETAYVVCTCCSQVPCLQIYTQQEDTHSCGPSSGLPLLRALPGPRWVRRKLSRVFGIPFAVSRLRSVILNSFPRGLTKYI